MPERHFLKRLGKRTNESPFSMALSSLCLEVACSLSHVFWTMPSMAPGPLASAQCSPTGSLAEDAAKETFVPLMLEQLSFVDELLL